MFNFLDSGLLRRCFDGFDNVSIRASVRVFGLLLDLRRAVTKTFLVHSIPLDFLKCAPLREGLQRGVGRTSGRRNAGV